ncbi:hypothetical protein [Oceanobacillus kimchii]|uniref:hypothetical protein n=1 Tax=Oceanobacillus kimchii TaxID=746691 RepID=UPI0009877FAB|nr:hypothetical protein [Oceanobacillus kimchii]
MNHLKRYWGIWSILLAIVVIISTYYAQIDHTPIGLDWKKTSGDYSELDNMDIVGSTSTVNQSVMYRLSANKSKDNLQQDIVGANLIDSRLNFYNHQQLNEYINEYKSFMRGKPLFIELYEETNEYVIFADTKEEKLMVEVLYKENKEVNKMEFPLEHLESAYVHISSFNYNDNQLYMILGYEKETSENGFPIMNYKSIRIDLDQEKIVEEKQIVENNNKQKEVELEFLDSFIQENKEYYLIVERTYNLIEESSESQYYQDTNTAHRLYLYDAEAGEQVELPEIITENSAPVLYKGNVLFVKEEGGKLSMELFDIDTQEIETVSQVEVKSPYSIPMLEVRGDNAYLLYSPNEGRNKILLNVTNINTGYNVFTGELIVNQSKIKGEIYADWMEFY